MRITVFALTALLALTACKRIDHTTADVQPPVGAPHYTVAPNAHGGTVVVPQ